MTELFQRIISELGQSSLLELTAVILAVVYLLLAVRQRIECWYAAFVSTAIFLYIFSQVDLYMESGLQVYYLAMAVYGWWAWRRHDSANDDLQVQMWPLRYHVIAISLIGIATYGSGQVLAGTDQRLPYLDSFTTWGAIVTTFMVTRKVLENWIYWLVIDAASIALYLDRELYFTTLLFMIYLVIIFFGFNSWLRNYRAEENKGEKSEREQRQTNE
ncbi:MAG: nicotinamide riboside transporter PnuC [Pseudomonadales bacterium]